MELFDPFLIKQVVDSIQWGAETLQELKDLKHFMKELRKAILPIKFLDKPELPQTNVFPPFRYEPLEFFEGKKVGLVCSGGSGALVTLCGVKRALEEAGVQIKAVSICSGSALWGSLIAAGLSSKEMIDFSFSLEPKDYIDLDILGNLWRIVNFLTGFTGILKGEAIEKKYQERFGDKKLGDLPIPLYSIVYNMDLGRVEYFGSKITPELTLPKVVRVAIALPLFIQSVKIGKYYYVDGGVVNIFPVEPLIKYEPDLDFFIGVNCIMPQNFTGENHTGWIEKPFSIIPASRQLRFAQWVELARLNYEMVKDKMLLIQPISFKEIRGIKFYRYFIDKKLWPNAIIKAYHITRTALIQLNNEKLKKR